MSNEPDYNQLGVPENYSRVVNSGAGGDTAVDIAVLAGEIWIAKFLTAYHADVAARVISWYLVHTASGIAILLPGNTPVAANIRNPFPMGTWIAGPLLLSPLGFTVRAVVEGASVATNCTIQALVHKIRGVSELI